MSPDVRLPHRVLLVREWDVQTSGSGCCGRFSSAAVGSLTDHTDIEDPYAHVRVEMEGFGAVYRALRDRCCDDEVELTVVDPRNAIWLGPTIWRDARRRGLSIREALRQVRGGTASRALICDGVVLSTGEVPEARQAVAAVEQDLSLGNIATADSTRIAAAGQRVDPGPPQQRRHT